MVCLGIIYPSVQPPLVISNMPAKTLSAWQHLCKASELCLDLTLNCGQAFGWTKYPSERSPLKNHKPSPSLETSWVGMISNKWVVELQTRDSNVYYRTICTDKVDIKQVRIALEDYFQLKYQLSSLYGTYCLFLYRITNTLFFSPDEWCKPKDKISTTMKCLPGLRLMRQDPVECLFSFICSSNNNISRITLMLKRLRETAGTLVLDQTPTSYYTFPDVDALCNVSEQDMRNMGFGYRARYVHETAKLLKELGGESYLKDLRNQENIDQVREALCQFTGIGNKVADCIALFSLDQLDVIPVDTHVRQIAGRYFDSKLNSSKTVTPVIYNKVGDSFRKRFPTYAGWAHSVLFAAELPTFRDQLTLPVKQEIEKQQSIAKKAKKRKTLS